METFYRHSMISLSLLLGKSSNLIKNVCSDYIPLVQEEAALDQTKSWKCPRKFAMLLSGGSIFTFFMLMSYVSNTGGISHPDDVTEVWHHQQTIGIVTLRGTSRVLVGCQLILVEGR